MPPHHGPAHERPPRRSLRRSTGHGLHAGVRPPNWLRQATYLSVIALLATGGAWLVVHYLSGPVDADLTQRSPIEPWALRLHGIAAYVFLITFGSLVSAHVLAAWHTRRSRGTGLSMVIAAVILVLTALALYYAPEPLHAPVSATHWVIGLLMPLLLLQHIYVGWRWRR